MSISYELLSSFESRLQELLGVCGKYKNQLGGIGEFDTAEVLFDSGARGSTLLT